LKEVWIAGLSNGFFRANQLCGKEAAKAGSPTKVAVAATKK
jgi:hypothetical protein